MANPRNSLDYTRINPEDTAYVIDGSTITYDVTKAGGSSAVGFAVKLSGNKTVALVSDGDGIYGKLTLVESDGKCAVQTGGFVDLPAGASATVTAMERPVGALGPSSAKGYIRNAASDAERVKSDARIVDAGTSTAVTVRLS